MGCLTRCLLFVLYLYTFEQVSKSNVQGCAVDVEHEFATIVCAHCGHVIKVPVYCRNRFCSVCSVHRNRAIRYKLTEFMNNRTLRKGDSFKFLTLTIKNQYDLNRMTDDILRSFRRLRQRSLWKKLVRGGAFVIEVTRKSESWHVHLHIVIESGFLPFKSLLSEWSDVSTGTGVYIKKIHSSQVVGYITKYLTKGEVPVQEQLFMTSVLKGRRLFQPFGDWFEPISQIKPLNYWCPDCDHSDWFYGTGSDLFRKSKENRMPVIRGPGPVQTPVNLELFDLHG